MRRVVVGIALLIMGCAADGAQAARATERAIVHAGLEALFVKREHAQAITLWTEGREFAPTLSRYGGPFDATDSLALWRVDRNERVGAGLPLRVEMTTLSAMEAFFEAEPAGWDAWFRVNHANAGIIEVVQPRIMGDSAMLVVGRACGEHCRTAWRLSLVRTAAGWRVHAVDVLAVPR